MGRKRALALLADLTVGFLLVDLPALTALGVMYFWFPDAPLRSTGEAAFALGLALFLTRDTTGGLCRKWLGLRIEDERGRPPGLARSIVRNLPLLVPGWNLYEAWRVIRDETALRSLDRGLRLACRRLA